uniref:BUD13 homolog n=1 Tax=Crassostrea virginica TaxID=6565 RepID=A0A8B8D6U8_CRAVI|nr:BUD13 homolog [Crassostrea virginica]
MSKLTKLDYLKRYSSDKPVSEGKKKRKKLAQSNTKSRIVDDDIDLKTLPCNFDDVSAYDNVEENIPTIADIVDERPKLVQQLEEYKTEKWKRVTVQSEKENSNAHRDPNSRKRRHDSDSDPSPQRKGRHDSDSDPSPPRKGRHDSGLDPSPPRRGRHHSNSDPSPPRRGRHDSDSDPSPPRKGRHKSDSDPSPPRKGRHDSDSDSSPPRKGRHDSDSDPSPQRKGRQKQGGNMKYSSKADSEKISKTLSGKKAGLSSAKDMKREADLLRSKEHETFKQIDPQLLGKDATTQIRKGGRMQKKRKEAEATQEEIKQREELEAKYSEWGKGIKQTEDKIARIEDHAYEMSKPLARSKDDKDLDAMLKDQERADDPMLAFIKKRKTKDNGKKDLPKYSGPPPPPNRFGIMPGYRWDGVDRSNGFEKSIYAKMSDKKAVADLAYKWSVEDM